MRHDDARSKSTDRAPKRQRGTGIEAKPSKVAARDAKGLGFG
jgi:hypothetical protein